jgi:hypothetical protein
MRLLPGLGKEMSLRAEFVADELKKLVGWGADPKRLAVAPRLRELAGVDGEPSGVAGYAVRRFVVEQIASLTGSHEFMGRQIEANTIKRALCLLLEFEGRGQPAEIRRYRAITVLGVFCSVEAWRRRFGPERELMGILAEHMTRPPNLQS